MQTKNASPSDLIFKNFEQTYCTMSINQIPVPIEANIMVKSLRPEGWPRGLRQLT